ncbi:hypothetical protein JCM14469_39060 [Desulfatiferula olefinivorans]
MGTPRLIVILLTWCFLCIPLPARADSTRSSGQDVASLLTTLLSSDAAFPERFAGNPQQPLADPDATLFFSRKYLNALLDAALKKPLYLDRDKGTSGSSIRADKLFVRPDARRNVLLVFVTGGVLDLQTGQKGLGGTLSLKQAEFELAPACTTAPDGQVILKTKVRCVGLDIEKTAPAVDISIARLLQSLYLDAGAIEDVNLSEKIPPLRIIQSAKSPEARLTRASIQMQDQGIEIRTHWSVNTRP